LQSLYPRAVEQADLPYDISAGVLTLIKPGVVFINTARGGVVDEVALIEATDAGKVFLRPDYTSTRMILRFYRN